MGILIKEMKFASGTFDVAFQLFDKKLVDVFNDIGLILCEQNEVIIKSGNAEFSPSDWEAYLETGLTN